MKDLIIENMELIITFITMGITWLLGIISKKNNKISNKIIPLQNIIIMIIACSIYYWATGEISVVLASGSPVATLIYDVIHNMMKEEV